MKQKHDKGYMRLNKMYHWAIQRYLVDGPFHDFNPARDETAVVLAAENTAVAGESSPGSATAVAVCSENPYTKHINKRSRTGAQYNSHQRKIVQDWKRRRSRGGGGIDQPRRYVMHF